MKLFVSEVNVIETDLYSRMAEDGEIIVYDCIVRAICDGEVYDHKVIFRGAFKDEYEGYYHVDYNAKKQAHILADRVADVSVINTDHWTAIGHVDEIYKTAEERLDEAWNDYSDYDLR